MKCDKGCSDLVIEGGDGINSVCPTSGGSKIDFKGFSADVSQDNWD